MKCSAEACDREVGRHGAKGLCPKHYRRLITFGSVDLPARDISCVVADCDLPRRARQLCYLHYDRLRRTGTVDRVRPSRLELILRRVNPTEAGCWEWQGAKVKGYGHSHFERKHYYAHVAMWEEHHGPVPTGLLVRHSCDNPPCCNPDHLLIGTALDNTQDMASRGRGWWQRPHAHDDPSLIHPQPQPHPNLKESA